VSELESVVELVDNLPEQNVTTYVLNALDFVVPGEWENVTGFANTVQAVTGTVDPTSIERIGKQVQELYADPSAGYQKAVRVYQVVDNADRALAAAALASKVGQKVSFLSFLEKLTPKADTTQSIDLAVKLVAEIVAFTLINGLPRDSIRDFVSKLAQYSGASKMRMAALVCLDGLVPLGPDFVQHGLKILSGASTSDLQKSAVFQRIQGLIPGESPEKQLRFIQNGFDSAQGWMNQLVTDRGLTPSKVLASVKRFVDISDEALDYVGAFFDATTNYYEHTGIQSVTRHLIEQTAG
jgi:hypothetical protein